MNLRTRLTPNWFLPALAISLATGLFVSNARAQMLYSDSEPAPRNVTYKFEIGPKSPQPPIMKYRLLPSHVELVPGNAAPLYHRAILLTSQKTANMENSREYWMKVEEYRSIPLADFPVEEVEKLLVHHDNAFRETAFAARRTYCDWELPTREHGTDLFGVLLPEIQEMRTLARLLALRIRLRIAQGRLDEAMRDLQTGYAMARHVGNRDFLVNALVGIAIAAMMHEQLLVAISQESTPNLYWSVVNFPTPLIDITNAVDVERDSFLIIFPELTEATKDFGDQAFWDQKLIDVISRRDYLNSGQTIAPDDTPSTEVNWEKMVIRTAIFSQVPRVKRELVEEMGYNQDAVAAMPGSRALLIYSRNNFERIRDDLLAPLGLPYYQASKFYAGHNNLPSRPIVAGDPLGIANVILPAVQQVDRAEVRSECWVDMLQVTEAIRDYAATHGSLPESLDQIEALPIPMNPYTNQPFLYTRQKDNPLQATLEEADSTLPQRFEITLRKP